MRSGPAAWPPTTVARYNRPTLNRVGGEKIAFGLVLLLLGLVWAIEQIRRRTLAGQILLTIGISASVTLLGLIWFA